MNLTLTSLLHRKTGRLGNSRHMKVRPYSREDYESELGGERGFFGAGGFVAALKACGYYGDHWNERSHSQASSCLGLRDEDYEVDRRGRALLLRRLPEGLPARARERLDQPEGLWLFAGDGRSSRDVGPDRKENGL